MTVVTETYLMTVVTETYLMTVVTETRHVHKIRYHRFYYCCFILLINLKKYIYLHSSIHVVLKVTSNHTICYGIY
jgi:hypothetical protein